MIIPPQISFLALSFCIFVHQVSLEMLSEEHCDADAEDDEASLQWYSLVYQFAFKNQNITQQLQRLEDKLKVMEHKLEKCQHQGMSNNTQTVRSSREIVMQRRHDGSENFYRTWDEYKHGFGSSAGEFFLGLEKVHKITNSGPHQLLIVMEDWENERRYAKYDSFAIGSEKEQYKLTSLGTYSGTAGDSLSYHLGFKFTTKDQDNDGNVDGNCATQYKGAWWHNKCHVSNLNGLYLNGTLASVQWAQGVIWKSFKDYTYSLKYVEMLLISSL